jgi:hypothetical protein
MPSVSVIRYGNIIISERSFVKWFYLISDLVDFVNLTVNFCTLVYKLGETFPIGARILIK